MRTETFFEVIKKLIFVDAVVVGPTGWARVQLVLDTGATRTTLVPSIAASIGCGPAASIRPTVMRTAAAEERGYLVELVELATLGVKMLGIDVNVADLGHDIDGLLGMDFLLQLNIELRPLERRILVELADAG